MYNYFSQIMMAVNYFYYERMTEFPIETAGISVPMLSDVGSVQLAYGFVLRTIYM